MKPKLTSLGVLFLFLSIFNYSYGQTIAVSGQVKNSSGAGEPLEGATITLKGTAQATTTDSQGNFSINVPQKGAVLVITNVGMKPEQYTVKSNAPVLITMESTRGTLEEVVLNVGYGTQKKSVNTGSISSIRSRDLEKVPNGTIATALQGRAAGVFVAANSGQPGSLSTIRIRGITTFGTDGNDPLFVIDGIPVDNGAINFLNQSDIESIEVLKDATAASIYGTRAAKGVILVTTKKGKAGKLTVGYNGFFGTSAPARRLDLLNATQYAVLMNEKSVAAGGSILFPDISTIGKGTDWQNEIFNNHATRFSHEVNVSGGNERSTFYLSLGWQNQEGIVSTSISNYERKNIRINSTHKISKVFTFGQTIGYAHQETRGIGNTNSEYGGPLSSAINLDPITPAVVTDTAIANAAPYSVNPVIRDANGNPYGISNLVGQEMTNPKAYERTRYGGYSWSDDFVGNTFLEINITKNVKIRSNIGGKLAYWGNQGFTPVFYLSPTVSVLKNNYNKTNNNTFNWTVENYITYDQKFGDHHVNAVAGQGAYVENNGGSSSVTLFDLPITSFEDASFNFDIPQANRTSGSSDFVKHKLSSIFGRLNYDYKERYLLTTAIRRDGSTRFGLNNKYGYFPSFSLGWVVTKEDFFTPNRFVRSLKLRGGYGRVGNDGIGDFGYVSRVQGGYNYTLGNTGAITTGYSPVTLSNPDLKWEEVRATDVGLDAQVFNDFILTLNFYNRKTVGILRQVRVPGYVGVSSSPLGNVASMKNSGFELELGYQKKLGPVNFSANGNFSTLKNKVTYVSADTNFIVGDAGFQSMGTVTRTIVGYAYNSFFGFKTAGIFQNMAEVNAYKNKTGGLIQPNAVPGDFRWQDTDGDGSITGKDYTYLGSMLPKITFGLTINLEYKGIELMAFGQGAAGGKIFQGVRRLDIINSNYQTKALSRWTGEGTSNSYPRLTNSDLNGNFSNMSDFYLEKGDYFRLKVVQLAYSFKNRFLTNKLNISKLRVYVTGENLATFTNYTGYDPEIGGGVLGVDKGYYPQARSFIAGVQVQF